MAFDLKDTSLSIIIDEIVCYVQGNAEEEFEKDNLEKECAYIHEGHCYIYGGKIPRHPQPGYFYKAGKKLTFIPALDMETNKVEFIRDTKKIKREMSEKENMKEIKDDIDITDLRIFAPPIKENDDYLKKTIKLLLQDLQIDLRQYKHKFSKEYDITNLKASVTKEAPMTMKYFLRWLEVLDCYCNMEIISKPCAMVRQKHNVKVMIE